MKVAELTAVIERVAQIHQRLGSTDNAKALRQLANILSTSGVEDVHKLVKVIRDQPSTPRRSARRRRR